MDKEHTHHKYFHNYFYRYNIQCLDWFYFEELHKLNCCNISLFYNKYYYPPGLPNPDSSAFCEKHLNDWSTHGVKFENPHAPKDCIANNNATKVISTTPYVGPGVVTKRVDENVYEWMNEATKGNLIRASGYKF